MTLKQEVIERWKKGQGIARIQREMKITLNIFDKTLRQLNACILQGRFEILGMNGERPFISTTEDYDNFISDLKNKLHRRNMQIKELKEEIRQLKIANNNFLIMSGNK